MYKKRFLEKVNFHFLFPVFPRFPSTTPFFSLSQYCSLYIGITSKKTQKTKMKGWMTVRSSASKLTTYDVYHYSLLRCSTYKEGWKAFDFLQLCFIKFLFKKSNHICWCFHNLSLKVLTNIVLSIIELRLIKTNKSTSIIKYVVRLHIWT